MSAAAGATLFHVLLAVVGTLCLVDLQFSPGVQFPAFMFNMASFALGVAALGFCVSLTLAIVLLPVLAGVARTLGGRAETLPAAVLFGGFISMIAFGCWELALAWRFKWSPEPVAGVLLLAGFVGQWGAAYASPISLRRRWLSGKSRGLLSFSTRRLLTATLWLACSLAVFKLPGYYLAGSTGSGMGPYLFAAMIAQPLGCVCVLAMVRRWPTAGDRLRKRFVGVARRTGLLDSTLGQIVSATFSLLASPARRTSS